MGLERTRISTCGIRRICSAFPRLAASHVCDRLANAITKPAWTIEVVWKSRLPIPNPAAAAYRTDLTNTFHEPVAAARREYAFNKRDEDGLVCLASRTSPLAVAISWYHISLARWNPFLRAVINYLVFYLYKCTIWDILTNLSTVSRVSEGTDLPSVHMRVRD